VSLGKFQTASEITSSAQVRIFQRENALRWDIDIHVPHAAQRCCSANNNMKSQAAGNFTEALSHPFLRHGFTAHGMLEFFLLNWKHFPITLEEIGFLKL